jgi:hypothetical protein
VNPMAFVIAAVAVTPYLFHVVRPLRVVLPHRAPDEPAYIGAHRRKSGQQPNAVLQYAIDTAGTHGLGMSSKRPDKSSEEAALSTTVSYSRISRQHGRGLEEGPSVATAAPPHVELVTYLNDQLRQYYSSVLGPVTTETDPNDVRLRVGHDVDALFMQAEFAAEVNSFLTKHNLCAPIIVMSGESTDWVFLTQPRTMLRLPVWEDLTYMGIRWMRRGDTIPLPTFKPAEGIRWLEPPQWATDLPPWTAVVGAARAVWTTCGEASEHVE